FAVTSGDSLFKFRYLPVGSYLLTVSPGGISKNIQVSEGENIFNDILDPAIYQDFQEIESNSAFTNATEINLDSRIHGKIYNAGDEDFFKFNIPEKGILCIRMYEVPQGLRPSIKIYDPSIPGRIVSQKGGSANEKIVLETEFDKPGLYYLLVRDWYGNIALPDSYSMNFNFIKTMDEYEPNETKEDAMLIDFGKNYFATVAVKADSDFYKLSIPDAGKVTVYLKDMPVNIRPYMKLYKDNGQNIDIKGGIAGEDVTMEFEVTNPSNYYIQVSDKYNSQSSFLRYRLLANYTPGNTYLSSDVTHFQKHEDIPGIDEEKQINFEIPAIDEKGKYYIDAVLRSSVSQEIARFVKAFYISEKFEIEVEANAEIDIFKLKVKNLSSARGIKLFAEARCGDYEKKIDFVLGQEKDLEFDIPGLDSTEKIYYGIYFESGKALYLNSYLADSEKPEAPLIKIIKAGCGKDAYEDGENIVLDWKIESGEECSVKLNADLINPDLDTVNIVEEEINLKKGINEINKEVSVELKQSGIYRVMYKFGEIGQGSIFFDVGQKEIPKENHEPVLFTIGEKEIIAGDGLEFFVEAADIDGDLLIYSAESLPKGARFDPWVKRFYWEPEEKQTGEYFITFIVSDGKAKVSEKIKITVSSLIGVIPEAKIIAEPLSGAAPLEVHFNSQLVNKYKGIVKYEWDFDGKGVYDFSSPESGEVIFTYTGEGSFPAALRVTDKNGITNTYVAAINVEKNPDAPGIYLTVSPLKGIAPCRIFFKGGAFCPQGISKYEWDFDGDGIFDAGSSKSGEVVKTYSLPGKYNAEFKVIGADGLSSSEKVLIEIEDPKGLSVKSSVLPVSGNIPLEVNFEATVTGSNEIQKYQWDFEGNGIFDYTSLNSGMVKHTYCEPGVYTPVVRVTDSNNLSSQAKSEVRFGISDPEGIKKGKIIVNSQKGKAPLLVRFSFETENEISDAEYLWDFEDDGAIDLITSAPQAEFTYNYPGNYMVKLDVRARNEIIMSCHEIIYVTTGKGDDKEQEISSENMHKYKIGRIELSDKTSLILPADMLDKDDIVNIKKIESRELPKEINFNRNKLIGEYREYKFKNRKDPFNKEMTISIPYPDKNIDELTLDAFWYDENSGEWKILSDALVFPKEDIVTVKTNHFTIFGIAGAEKKNEDVPQPESPGKDSSGESGCFIATAAFGTPLANEVIILSEFRDKVLLKHKTGKRLVSFYYSFSPQAADFIRHKPFLKSIIRFCIKFLVIPLKIMLK
ncbi:MAG: PKD domain-containing protein, partial [Candidatus Omnitrophota bacterium]|nr:PKD domain-containing protein [Candidatus Omnitrophota bacterium]